MELLLVPLPADTQTYIRSLTYFYNHNTIPRSLYPYTIHAQEVLSHNPEPITLDRIPTSLRSTIKAHFGTANPDTISMFINAHLLGLLPTPTPATPNTERFRRWPMTITTSNAIKAAAAQINESIPSFIINFQLPTPQPKLTFLPRRLVTTYLVLITDDATIDRYSTYYDKSLLVAHQPPRTNLAKAGAALDHIFDQQTEEN